MTLVIQMQTVPRYNRTFLSLLTKWHVMTQGPTASDNRRISLKSLPKNLIRTPEVLFKARELDIIPRLIHNPAHSAVEKSTKSMSEKDIRALREVHLQKQVLHVSSLIRIITS